MQGPPPGAGQSRGQEQVVKKNSKTFFFLSPLENFYLAVRYNLNFTEIGLNEKTFSESNFNTFPSCVLFCFP